MAYEEINITIERVKLLKGATLCFENAKFEKMILNNHQYPLLRKDKELAQDVNRNITKFFQTLLEKRDTSNHGILGILNYIDSCSFSLRELGVGRITVDDEGKFSQVIDELWDLLDLINFRTETVKMSAKHKIMSSHRDQRHLTHAYKSNVFITDDKKLKDRGKYIYSLLGFDVSFFTVEEFRQKYIES